MKQGTTIIGFISLLIFSSPVFGSEDGLEMLDNAITKPGSYSQMCDIQTVPTKIPIPLYALSMDSEAVLSR